MLKIIGNVIDRISFFNGYSSVEKVEKGYSPDNKYIVIKGLNKYLLRISDNITKKENQKISCFKS
ncbi:hypothetical protein [Metabacillus lacus]|uniref:hypothetical protein n=1 Tax=Metabacillus lacus TaxID=1983721 RepID=UPI001FE3B5BB|nr:hypothetical protein [Metabacillus lacus]